MQYSDLFDDLMLLGKVISIIPTRVFYTFTIKNITKNIDSY